MIKLSQVPFGNAYIKLLKQIAETVSKDYSKDLENNRNISISLDRSFVKKRIHILYEFMVGNDMLVVTIAQGNKDYDVTGEIYHCTYADTGVARANYYESRKEISIDPLLIYDLFKILKHEVLG